MDGKCPVCGAPMKSYVCEYCGYKKEGISNNHSTMSQQQIVINNQNIVTNGMVVGVSRKDKTIALLLCIFLGVLGIHRFYVGKIGSGLLYLFTGGLFGIGWIVDICLIASGNFKDNFDLPLRQ